MQLIPSLTLTAALALAQDDVVIFNRTTPMPAQFRSSTLTVTSDRMENAVKGVPYSADSITETVQALADGNRITRVNKSSFARDSEGRTRRESSIEGLGPLGKTASPVQNIFIDDPVTKTSYTLDPRSKTAFKSNSEAGMVALKEAMSKGLGTVQMRRTPGPAESAGDAAQMKRAAELAHMAATRAAAKQTPNQEDLGTRNIEGVTARGTRLTMTIPAGEVGNERAIQVVTESWYSGEIKATVLVKHSDPRVGETTTSLGNLRLGEPSKTLFEPPADYRVEEYAKTRMVMPAEIRVREDR